MWSLLRRRDDGVMLMCRHCVFAKCHATLHCWREISLLIVCYLAKDMAKRWPLFPTDPDRADQVHPGVEMSDRSRVFDRLGSGG